ncbi:unnamed protein product [Effrenium voratum]|uniref:Uncharacterized protein n=1 Tax=Effrenium voratum TaxID=2562239 RepID=A0AA36IXV8_9DINO|nr:unnamed protein product [Effrenium voratum]CAJ1453307.1 unnamed protein product [Effrenium voratum]
MVNVLWGVAAMKLDGENTAAEVLAKFREAMQLQDWNEAGKGMNLYRLVPVTDHVIRLAEQEQLLVHLPGSAMSCAAIEEVYQQLEDAELRYERSKESVMALVDALRSREAPSEKTEVKDVQRLRQENSTLRRQLELSEYSRRVSEQRSLSTEECQASLMRELVLARQEVEALVTPRRPIQRVPAAPLSLSAWDGAPPFVPIPSMPCPGTVPPAHHQLAGCHHTNSQPGSNPCTPRVPQLRLPLRTQTAGPPMTFQTQSCVARPGSVFNVNSALVERMRDPMREPMLGTMEAPQQACMSVGVTAAAAAAAAAGRGTPTSKVKASPLRMAPPR